MNEQPSHERMDRMKMPNGMRTVSLILLRLLVAFVCGWLFAFLVIWVNQFWRIFDYYGSYSPFDVILPFPLFPGIAAALTIARRTKHLILLAIGTGLLFWAGIGTYFLPGAIHNDAVMNAYCATHYCHVSGIDTGILFVYLCYGVVLMLLGSIITGLIMKHTLKERRKEKSHPTPEAEDGKNDL